jgi:hypothetical protein
MPARRYLPVFLLAFSAAAARAGVGDPQIRTEHPWYPGELSCSTFERLFQNQAQVYHRVTGRPVESDEDKALASWYWRNWHVYHGYAGPRDFFGRGLDDPEDHVEYPREYWSGLFADGFAICYATHSQWCAEMEKLLGRGRCRAMEIHGHTTFEAYLTGGAYGAGRWALLDHDISTVIFTPDGSRLMSLAEIRSDPTAAAVRTIARARQHGWLPAGLYADDIPYSAWRWASYAFGYAGPPPMLHLRAGESVRRYLVPGLEDGKTFVYWGVSYFIDGIPGPCRDRTWVNQPEKMYQTREVTPHPPGQARYGNAVYTYRPDFSGGRYREAVVEEGAGQVTFEFVTPYIIAATPPAAARKEQWGICKSGCTGGLTLHGTLTCPVAISTDHGRTWKPAGTARDGLDLTDLVKGRQQYWIRFAAGAKELAGTGLTIRTVCQISPCMVPHLAAGENRITFQASGKAVFPVGPERDWAAAHVLAGKLGSPAVTVGLAAPRGEPAVGLYVAAQQMSGVPPVACRYHVDYSSDGGRHFLPLVKDWQIVRHPPEPNDWAPRSYLQGDVAFPAVAGPLQVQFSNTAERDFPRVEAHLVYEAANPSPLRVTFAWRDAGRLRTATHTYPATPGKTDRSWTIAAGERPQTEWVEYAAE